MGEGGRFEAAFQADLLRLFRWRRDVRRFRRDPVDDKVFEAVLAAAWLSPSVGLSQPWRLVTIDDPARREAVRANFERCNQAALAVQADERAALYARLKLAGLAEAPRHLAVFVEPDPAQGHGLGRQTMPETVAYSGVIAIHTLWLAARAAGLGVGWVSVLDPAELHAALSIDPAWRFVAYLCIGHPESESTQPELENLGWETRLDSPADALLRR